MGVEGVELISMWITREGEIIWFVSLCICKVYPVFSALGWTNVPEGVLKSNKRRQKMRNRLGRAN